MSREDLERYVSGGFHGHDAMRENAEKMFRSNGGERHKSCGGKIKRLAVGGPAMAPYAAPTTAAKRGGRTRHLSIGGDLRNLGHDIGDKFSDGAHAAGKWLHGAADSVADWANHSSIGGDLRNLGHDIGDKFSDGAHAAGNWLHGAADSVGNWVRHPHFDLGGPAVEPYAPPTTAAKRGGRTKKLAMGGFAGNRNQFSHYIPENQLPALVKRQFPKQNPSYYQSLQDAAKKMPPMDQWSKERGDVNPNILTQDPIQPGMYINPKDPYILYDAQGRLQNMHGIPRNPTPGLQYNRGGKTRHLSIGGDLKDIGYDIRDKVADGAHAAGKWLHGAADSVADWANHSSIGGDLRNLGHDIGDKFSDGAHAAGNWLHGAADSVGNWVRHPHFDLGGPAVEPYAPPTTAAKRGGSQHGDAAYSRCFDMHSSHDRRKWKQHVKKHLKHLASGGMVNNGADHPQVLTNMVDTSHGGVPHHPVYYPALGVMACNTGGHIKRGGRTKRLALGGMANNGADHPQVLTNMLDTSHGGFPHHQIQDQIYRQVQLQPQNQPSGTQAAHPQYQSQAQLPQRKGFWESLRPRGMGMPARYAMGGVGKMRHEEATSKGLPRHMKSKYSRSSKGF